MVSYQNRLETADERQMTNKTMVRSVWSCTIFQVLKLRKSGTTAGARQWNAAAGYTPGSLIGMANPAIR